MRTATLLLAFFGLIYGTSLLIAQPFDPSSITPNATVNGLLEGLNARRPSPGNSIPGAPSGSTGTTQLKGYVGPPTTDAVRLYWDLTLSRYWEIPRSAILSQLPGNGPNDPITIFVPSATPITIANSMPAEAVVIQRAIIDGLGNISFEGPGIGPGHVPGQPTLVIDQTSKNVLTGFFQSCATGHALGCLNFAAGCVATSCLAGLKLQ
jgi:hypothetical protein